MKFGNEVCSINTVAMELYNVSGEGTLSFSTAVSCSSVATGPVAVAPEETNRLRRSFRSVCVCVDGRWREEHVNGIHESVCMYVYVYTMCVCICTQCMCVHNVCVYVHNVCVYVHNVCV